MYDISLGLIRWVKIFFAPCCKKSGWPTRLGGGRGGGGWGRWGEGAMLSLLHNQVAHVLSSRTLLCVARQALWLGRGTLCRHNSKRNSSISAMSVIPIIAIFCCIRIQKWLDESRKKFILLKLVTDGCIKTILASLKLCLHDQEF